MEHTIVHQLKNMPVLKNLALCTPELSIADMEILHNNVPSIQTLNLNNLAILDSELPANIIPTSFLTNVEFEMSSMVISDFYYKWYLYMSKKYVNVKEWYYGDENQGELDDKAEHFYKNGFLHFLELVAPTQSSLSLDHIPTNTDIFQALDSIFPKEINMTNCLNSLPDTLKNFLIRIGGCLHL